MSDQEQSTHSGDASSPQPSVANNYIQGDYSGNSGSNNTMNSGNTNSFNVNSGNINCGNTTNYYGNTSSPPSDSEILQCLYTSKYQSHRRRVREPAEGTCTWVTEHPKYTGWLGQPTPGLLWLSADPGCGKSVTASFLVTHLNRQNNAIVCYFFFKDDNDEQKSAPFALSAILHQLFSQKNTLCKYAEEAFKAKGKSITEEVDTLWDILVQAVAEGGCGEVICVVDALDECEENSLAQFIRCLASLHRVQTPGQQTPDIRLKFIVTARPYHKIERALGLRAMTIRLRGEDEVNAISADVTRVIDEGIKDLESYWQRPGGLGHLRELLETSADRTFLWVSLMLEILKDSVDDSHEAFTNLFSTVPRDLAELYTKILDKSKDPDQARRILHVVVAAARPFTILELNIAFRIRRDHKTIKDIGDASPRSEATVKNLCGLFVRIIDSKVYLVHQTAREFLIKGSSPGHGNWQYTLCPMDSSLTLADICISYLSLQEFENDPLVTDAVGVPTAEVVRDYVQRYVFLDYAANHWLNHFRDSTDRQMELFELTTLICKRGSNRFLTWLRVYWENNCEHYRFPPDFTHLMIASWLGHQSVVKRLLKERASINARASYYGTALNVAALRQDKDTAAMLVQGGVNAYLHGKEYNLLLTWRKELWDAYVGEHIRDYGNERREERRAIGRRRRIRVIEFLLPFCIQGPRDLHTLPSRLFNSLR